MDFDREATALDELRAEIDELVELDEPTEEQVERLDAALNDFETRKAVYEDEKRRQARIDEIRSYAIEHPAAVIDGDGAHTPEVVRDRGDIYDLTTIRSAPMQTREYGGEVRDRAMHAITDATDTGLIDAEHAETVEKLVKQAGRGPVGRRDQSAEIARHILVTGSPEYREAFADYVAGDPTAVMRVPDEARTAMSLTGANGGFLVPFTLDPTIILTNDGATNPFRAISRQVSITTDDWNGVSSAGVSAEWLAEATEAADATPTFAQPSITVHKASAYLQASIEVTQDSGIASDIGMLLNDAKARLEASAFATGTGSGQPAGIVTALGLTTASRVAGSSGDAGAADLVAADIYALDNDLGARYRPNASFIGERTTWNAVRQLGVSNAYHAFWVDFGGGLPPSLIGYPVYESSAMDSTIVSGSNDDVIVLGDFSNYVIVDRIGMAVAYNPLVISTSNNRPTGEVGWFAYWRVGGDSVNDAGFRMLRL